MVLRDKAFAVPLNDKSEQRVFQEISDVFAAQMAFLTAFYQSLFSGLQHGQFDRQLASELLGDNPDVVIDTLGELKSRVGGGRRYKSKWATPDYEPFGSVFQFYDLCHPSAKSYEKFFGDPPSA